MGSASKVLPQRVVAKRNLVPGDIHVDAVARYLYHIEKGGTAMRYGVAIAKGDLYEPGTYTIKRKVKWPHWTPTKNMIERNPEYEQYADGMEPGPTNALGSRALYLLSAVGIAIYVSMAHRIQKASAVAQVLAASGWSWLTSTNFIPTSR